MSNLQIITESIFQKCKIDEEKMIIEDVAILGRTSKNKREYSNKAFKDAIRLFEGSPAYFEHESKKKVKDLIGQFKDVKEKDNQIKGNLHVLENQNWLMDMAKRMPTLAGFSINASGSVKNVDGKEIVESLTNRVSVDLVTQPATVKNLFESENLEEKEDMDDLKKLQEENIEIKVRYEELKEKVALLEYENNEYKEAEEKKLQEEKQNKLIDKKLKEAKIEKKNLSETMLEVFQEADEERIDKLIEDITNIQKSKISFGDKRNLTEEKSKDTIDIKRQIKESLGG